MMIKSLALWLLAWTLLDIGLVSLYLSGRLDGVMDSQSLSLRGKDSKENNLSVDTRSVHEKEETIAAHQKKTDALLHGVLMGAMNSDIMDARTSSHEVADSNPQEAKQTIALNPLELAKLRKAVDASKEKLSADDDDSQNRPNARNLPTFPMLLDKVLLTDVVWVPKQFKIVLLACTPKLFTHERLHLRKKRELKLFGKKAESFTRVRGVAKDQLESPLALQQGLSLSGSVELQSCDQVIAPETNDDNIAGTIFAIHCYHSPSNLQQLSLSYEGMPIAHFFLPSHLNAASSMAFRRSAPVADFSVSVLIKGVFDFSPYVTEVVEYYRRQGISHVYLGVFPTDGDIHERYRIALWNQTDLVSIGGMNKMAETFRYLGMEGFKLSYMPSALYHAKSFDDMMIVVDMDEVMTAMRPSERSIVSILRDIPDREKTCYFILSTNSATSPKWRKKAASLVDLSPNRCYRGGGNAAHEKSVAVLSNADFVGLHYHGACRKSTIREKSLNQSEAKLLHFTDFWFHRWPTKIHLDRIRRDAGNQLIEDPCNTTNEFVRFMRSEVSFEGIEG